MNTLASSATGSLNIEEFDMEDTFFTDSVFFKKLTLSERAFNSLEILVAMIFIVLLSPLMLIVAVAIKFSMGGDVFYRQVRVGKNGQLFSIIKFRSMVENAEASTGPTLATKNDPRITSLGRFLRSSHLDEFPQLFNVLTGEMSFVGPRPERPEFVNVFEKEIGRYSNRKDVKPGITGLAQVCLPYDATAREKLQYDLYYIDNRQSVLFNFMISYYTALKMVTFFKS
jgi:lipopolysaccharide/colanic/teichoic acid biosynthesis glycosyltransferase